MLHGAAGIGGIEHVEVLLEHGADACAYRLDAAHGRHQRKKYRWEWPEAIALLSRGVT